MSSSLKLKVITPIVGFRYVRDDVLVKEVERVFITETAQELLQSIDSFLLGSSGPQFGTYVQDLKSIFTKLKINVEFIDENGKSIGVNANSSGV